MDEYMHILTICLPNLSLDISKLITIIMFSTVNDQKNIEAEFTKTCFDTLIGVCNRKCTLSDHALPTTELLEEHELESEQLILN